MQQKIHGALALVFAVSTLNGCVVYRQVPADPNDPRLGAETPPGEEQQPPGAGQGEQNPAVAQQQPPVEEPVAPRRRRRIAPRVDVAPRVSAPTIFGEGTGGAFRGLVYLMPDDVERLPDFSRLTPVGEVFTDHFDVRPQDFHGGFPGFSKEEEWFAIKYEGTVMLPEGGMYRFRLVSDDGSALYLDGTKVIENDGVHGVRSVNGTANLSPGRHQLRLDYFQGNKGPVALQLFVTPPSGPAEMVLQGAR
jgi:PA14 domain-containing protein